MVTGGAEMMLGAINDPTFGHVIVCGSGGVLIELLADSACRLHPVTDQDAAEMVASLKGVQTVAVDSAAARRPTRSPSAKPCCESRRSWQSVRRSRSSMSIH